MSFSWQFKCPCNSGSFIWAANSVNQKHVCTDCGHPISIHKGFEEGTSQNPIVTKPLPATVSVDTELKSKQQLSSNDGGRQHTMATDSLPATVRVETEGQREQQVPTNSSAADGTSGRSQDAMIFPKDFDYTCSRSLIVANLANCLKKGRAVFVWGPSGSGKTTLALLLQRHLKTNGTKAVFIDDWFQHKKREPWNHDWKATLWQFCQGQFRPTTTAEKGLQQQVTFIIDEAQSTWELSNMFWTDLVSPCLKWTNGPSFCFFSSCNHDNKSIGSSRVFSLFTKYPPWMLMFKRRPEFSSVVDEFCRHPTTSISLDGSAQDYLYRLTIGHPNVLRSVLIFIDKVSRANHNASGYDTARREVGLKEIEAMLDDDNRVFNIGQLGNVMYGKPLPRQAWNPFKDIFRKVLSEGKIEYCPTDDKYGKRLDYCYNNGILFLETRDDGCSFLVFPSPLHQRYVKWLYRL